jgi:tight adherence protein C
LAALGYFAPDVVLIGRAQARQQIIQRELPDVLDQITVSVEAGLGFDAALAQAGRNGKGPLAEELARTMQDVAIGVPRLKALAGLLERTDVPDLRHFVLAVKQAEQYGVPIAQVLRVQSTDLREKRRQRAEEQAMKIPVKIVFPLVFCILPALFVVILGPAGMRVADALFRG